ncbi:MAG: hypothetical protein PHX83_04510 [Acidobacteriia bacterium]|nr:hypothetical protein [Terriglobia bacterium]
MDMEEHWWTLHGGAALLLINGVGLANAEPASFRLSANAWLICSAVMLFAVLMLAMGVQGSILKKMMKVHGPGQPG